MLTSVPTDPSSTATNTQFATSTQSIIVISIVLFNLLILVGLIFLIVLAVRALLKYLRTKDAKSGASAICKSLGGTIKEHRTRCGMTQEFVAENLGVSRQAVSKWENGTSEPSTSNLIAIAKLFGISPAELLQEFQK